MKNLSSNMKHSFLLTRMINLSSLSASDFEVTYIFFDECGSFGYSQTWKKLPSLSDQFQGPNCLVFK